MLNVVSRDELNIALIKIKDLEKRNDFLMNELVKILELTPQPIIIVEKNSDKISIPNKRS